MNLSLLEPLLIEAASFLVIGLICIGLALFLDLHRVTVIALVGFSSLWSIGELKEQ